MKRALHHAFWIGPALMLIGSIVLVSPWTMPVYLWLFPAERTNVAYQLAGGPYPELLGVPVMVLGTICYVVWLLATGTVKVVERVR